MRRLPLAFLALTLPATGCTALVVGSGRNPSSLTKRTVTEEFGTPAATDNPDGTSSLTFRTRRKLAEPNKLIYATMGFVCTFGLGELIWFPNELYRAGRTALVGCDVRVDYYPTGEVKAVWLNGDQVYSGPEPTAEPPAPAKPVTAP